MGVCGPVGSGKSSLLATVLGHTTVTRGRVNMAAAERGSVALAAQQAWIFHATVRDNIVFGEEFDREKFDKGR